MAIERARVRAVEKPWGAVDLRPWSDVGRAGVSVGELWYERRKETAPVASLLLKLLITTQPLSIQVHPDDAFAQTMGLPGGKTEAWYILSAAPGAKVAVGLRQRITSRKLRQAIDDGSIADLVQWRRVVQDDVVFVPAGTIHAIGKGLVIAEIQQRSDTTFRMFDFGRRRELHVDNAAAVADAGPAEPQAAPSRFTDARSLLVVDPHFVLERINLSPGSVWSLCAEQETWLFVASGNARVGSFEASVADALFVEGERVRIEVGPLGLKCLAAYPGPVPAPRLLGHFDMAGADPGTERPARPPTEASPNRRTETHQ